MMFRKIKDWFFASGTYDDNREPENHDFSGVPFMKFPQSKARGYLRRTRIVGKVPDKIEENEVMYNIADDRFFVGTGNNFFKIYETTT
jgi:hypothetical protein